MITGLAKSGLTTRSHTGSDHSTHRPALVSPAVISQLLLSNFLGIRDAFLNSLLHNTAHAVAFAHLTFIVRTRTDRVSFTLTQFAKDHRVTQSSVRHLFQGTRRFIGSEYIKVCFKKKKESSSLAKSNN